MALVSVELGIKSQSSCCSLSASSSGRLRPVSLTKSRRKHCAVVAELKLFEHESASFEDAETSRLLTTGRLVQWYPGHIAKAERELKDRLQLVDVVIDVRDARIPLSTGHPKVDEWIEGKKRVLALNREDMIPTADKNAWADHFSRQGFSTVFTDARRGKGTMKLMRKACSVASAINAKRKEKGLLPRAVRAAVIGYPNVGKSSLINRLVKRRVCIAAPRPGVTRNLRWTTIGDGLDLLDAPGILPMRIDDQEAAVKIAICNDIGEGSYAVAGVAAVLIERLKRMPTGPQALAQRYKFDPENHSGESFLEELAQVLFRGDANQAATRVLGDFRKGKLGWHALESPS